MSGDKAVKDVARRITAETQQELTEQLREPWGRKSRDGIRVFNHYCEAWDSAARDENRGAKVPDYSAQLRMIEDLERRVLIST